ncbi:MAG: hypothetical protein IJ298_05570 [Ruminococcus sp.]|nr:hypothetical protein [Ruminococcus sp.]
MDTDKSKLKDLLTKDKTRRIIIAVALIAIALIFLSSFLESDKDTAQTEDISSQDYQRVLSDEILSMVTSVEGAGEAKVLLTLENSYEYIYLDDGKTLQKINEPTIRGVVVACKGADSPIVCENITQLLTTVLNIPSTKVCISKLN